VRLIIIDLLYVYASVMLKFIKKILSNFSNIFGSTVVYRSDYGFQSVTATAQHFEDVLGRNKARFT
jgi:hypothetical protein